MAKYAVNEQGIQSLNDIKSNIDISLENLSSVATQLKSRYESEAEKLGPHFSDIEKICETITSVVQDSQADADSLKVAIDKLIDKYEAIIVKKISADTGTTVENNGKSGGTSSGGSSSSNGVGEEKGPNGQPLSTESFVRDITGFKDTLSLGHGDGEAVQAAGPYKSLPSSSKYERHHIPSKAVLEQFGINTNEWPCICLENSDHAKTDSYRAKQKRKYKSYFSGDVNDTTYKERAIGMVDTPGGFTSLIIDEVLNIREACGDKYDQAISDYLDCIKEYISKNGIPKR